MAHANQPQPQFYNSQRGQNKMYCDGYIYTKNKSGKDNIVYWRCEDRSCSGKAKTDGDDIISSSDHPNHTRVDFHAEVQITQALIKVRAAQSYEPSSTVVSAETANISDAAKALLPSEKALKQAVQRERRRVLPPLPVDLASINLQDEWTETLSGDGFLLAGTGPQDPNRILVFSTHENLIDLTLQGVTIGDGTFSSVPYLFTQLYTLHGFVGGKCIPLVFGLLPSKTEVD